tara:strand:- start:217 stop:1092 length:876 start_codon:yes stop_codon:yes gene_type:complete
MPFDNISQINPSAFDLSSDLNFEIAFEPTRSPDHKYLVATTGSKAGEVLSVVNNSFNCVSHPKFYNNVFDVMTSGLSSHELEGVEVNYKTAANHCWSAADINFPNTARKITTDKHEVEVRFRMVLGHGISGLQANTAMYGSIDWYCHNGQFRSAIDAVSKIRKKNSKNFSFDTFLTVLSNHKNDFLRDTEHMQQWADTDISKLDVKETMRKIVGLDSKADALTELYESVERPTRGANLYSLFSCMTNYSSHSLGNGFELRNNGKDNDAISMAKREAEVQKWINSPVFEMAA